VLAGCRPEPPVCNGNFSGLMPKDWSYIGQWPLDTDGKKQLDCVVLYRFDATKGGQKITPVGGVVYRQDHGHPRWIYPHLLTPPDNFYLGEGQVMPRADNVLTGSPEPELIISDTDKSGVIVQATIFGWRDTKKDQPDAAPDPNAMNYKPLGLFQGDAGVSVEIDKATVLVRRKDTRSQLAERRVFVPRGDKKNYYTGDSFELPPPIEIDLISLSMGDDPTVSPYPEKTVLAFYQAIKDDAQLDKLMTPDALGNLKVNKLPYGCPLNRQDLDRVFVQDLDWNLGTEGQPEVAATGYCRLTNGALQPMTQTTWQLEKNAEGKWRLKGATQ
jgi:hypothetical protein